ncbi:MAG: hypothetical protein ABFC31_11520 [Clostridiaceae bacterium]
MLLYHGSSKSGLQTLQPFTADHGKPYVYFSTNETAAAFYAAGPVERPYYWFPYSFDAACKAVYTETYPEAFHQTYHQKSGTLYICEVADDALLRFPSNPFTRLSAKPVQVTRSCPIENLHDWFLQRECDGALLIQRYETVARLELASWHGKVLEDLRAACAQTRENAFAAFVQRTMPQVWERFISEPEYECSYAGPII